MCYSKYYTSEDFLFGTFDLFKLLLVDAYSKWQIVFWFCFSDTMAVPPCYADLGKSAKDIFNKGYGNFLKSLG